jgi:hypothetical protein
MFGRGSLNGSQVNSFPVNGGVFVEELRPSSSISVGATATLVRRPIVEAASHIALDGEMFLTARRSPRGTGTASLGHSAILVRRATVLADAPVAAGGSLRLVRRVTVVSSARVSLVSSADLSWAYLHRADSNRVMRVHDVRVIRLHADIRSMAVGRRPPQMVAARERGGRP